MNKFEKQHVKQLVLDCDTYRLSEKEALEYISSRFGRSISARQYYRIKRISQSDDTIQKWFEFYSKKGFVIELKKRMEEIEHIQKISMQLLLSELDKPESEQNKNWLIKLIHEIRENNNKLAEHNLCNPIIQKVKKRLDEAEIKVAQFENRVSIEQRP